MGSCLSKPSSKGSKKNRKETSVEEEREASVGKKKKPWKPSEEEVPSVSVQKKSRKALEEVEEILSFSVDNAACSLPSPQIHRESSSPLRSLPADVAFAKTEKQKLPPASPPVQKLSPPPSISPDPVIFPPSSQTPLKKKLSGELPMNSLRRPSSPCKSLLHNMPSSPGLKKSINRNEEEECKFPSLARKQWLSQAYVAETNSVIKGPGVDDSSAEGHKVSAGENISKERNSCPADMRSRPRGLASKESGTDVAGRMNKGCEPKAVTNTSKFSATEAVNLAGKTVSSRTNSLSRDMSPVEPSRAKARPASPLKRSPSISAMDGPRLSRSASGKVASPNRSGLPVGERHDAVKVRTLHKQSLSKEFLMDPSAETNTHKRSTSRDSVSEFSAEIIRKPSPPKKTPIIPASASLSSMDASRLTARRPSTPSKEDTASNKPIVQEPSMARGGRIPSQRSLNSAVHEPDNLTASNNNRSTKRKEKSPLRRTCNGMATLHSSTRMGDRNTDYSINSDTTAASQFDLLGKDSAARTRKSGIRTPLKEISENSNKLTLSKQGIKEVNGPPVKARNEMPVQKESVSHELLLKGESNKGFASQRKTDDNANMLDLASNINDYVKDPLEVKAENLVMGGKSVLSAFKALEEYRLKYSNSNVEPRKDADEDVWYSRQQLQTTDKENFSQPLQGKAPPKDDLQQAPELLRSRSTKKSCEQFLFPDVQSLLMSVENEEGMQLEGGMTMPASISKACSILRAVADLNMGTPMYPKKKEAHDEIEAPNLLSFQFGEGDSHRVTLS